MYLEHANLTVKSIDKSIEFLSTAFPDFSIRGQGESETSRWLHFGNQQTYLALQQNHVNSGAKDQAYLNNGINHLGFVVNNIEEISDNLSAKGYLKADASIDEKHRRRAYFFDENQIEWEFIEYLSDENNLRNQY